MTPRKSSGFSKTWARTVSPNGTKNSLGHGSYPVVTLAMGRAPRRRMQQALTFAQANETVIAIGEGLGGEQVAPWDSAGSSTLRLGGGQTQQQTSGVRQDPMADP